MFETAKLFFKSDDGAVSTDWVVITSFTVLLGFVVGVLVRDATIVSGNEISNEIAGIEFD